MLHNRSLNSFRIILSVLFLMFFMPNYLLAQALNWPAESWANARNLTSVMNATDLIELSGLHWNPNTQRLYIVQDNGRFRVLQYHSENESFTEIANLSMTGNPEGIMQVDYDSNIFYTADEKNYEIRQYSHSADFSTVSLLKKWRLLTPHSPMTDTGNNGIEGIAFIPDSYLEKIGFVSSVTGMPYTSQKGMGGLIFLAHQDVGNIWVYDVDPELSFEFIYVGNYKTNRKESCDLAFDRTTGLLYILHNVGNNFIEVTDLSLVETTEGELKFTTLYEYRLSNPTDGDTNIEGIAISPFCENTGDHFLFLCRDINNSGTVNQKEDVLRLFKDFPKIGTCSTPTEISLLNSDPLSVEFCESKGLLINGICEDAIVFIHDINGQLLGKILYHNNTYIPISRFKYGINIITIQSVSGECYRLKLKL